MNKKKNTPYISFVQNIEKKRRRKTNKMLVNKSEKTKQNSPDGFEIGRINLCIYTYMYNFLIKYQEKTVGRFCFNYH